MAAGVDPQSSCSFRPIAPARICSSMPSGQRRVALAEEAEVHRQRVGRLQHQLDVPRARRARRRVGAGRRSGAAADERRDAARQRLVHLLRADEMDVRVDAAGREDQPLAGDRLRRHADDHPVGHAGHDVGIAGLADAGDAAALDADVGLADAGPVDDQRVGDDAVERAVVGDAGGLSHAVAQHLAAAELALVAVDGRVRLPLPRRDACRPAERDRRSSARRCRRSAAA